MTAFDGWVPLAGADLLARAVTHPMSPSRLEVLGTCPRKYFFARALGITAPEEFQVESHRWLTALDIGTLLHNVFERFLTELREHGQTLHANTQTAPLMRYLEEEIAKVAQRIPIPNAESYERQCGELREMCEIFLEKEAEYAHARQAEPWLMEVSLGASSQPDEHRPTEN